MLKSVMITLLLAILAGCVDTTSEEVTSSGGGSSTGTVGGASTSTGTSTGSASGGSATGRKLTSAGASSGTSTGAPATTGGNTPSTNGSSTGGETSGGGATGSGSSSGASSSGGSSSAGSTSGGSTTGGATLAQACTDYIAGASSAETCLGGGPAGPTVAECEAILAVCTAADDVIIDEMGQCLENMVCSGNFEDDVNSAMACEAPASTLSQACQKAGDTPPDGGEGEGTTGGATGG